MNVRSLTFRLVAWYCAFLLLLGVVFAAYTYFGFNFYIHSTLRDTLAARADDIVNMASPVLDDSDALNSLMERRFAPEAHDRFIRILVDGDMKYVSGDPIEHSFDPHSIGIYASAKGHLRQDGKLWIFSKEKILPDGRHLLIDSGQLGQSIIVAQRGLIFTLLIALPLLLCFAAAGGYRLVRRALTPVATMINAAEALTFNSPHRRLPIAGTHDLIDDLGRALNRMLERLDNAYQHARRFSADAAHEIRTPLTIMRSELELAAPRSNLDAETRNAIGNALEETVRLSQIVENLITLAQVEGGGGKRAHLAVDLRALTLETIEQMQLLAEEKHIALSCAEGSDVQTLGDRNRLKQIIVNLIDNAIKYTGTGGQVTVHILQEAGHAVLKVADTGIGISPDHQASIFERFFRVDPDRGITGAGLGLAIIKSICVAHGGSISVESVPEEGSTFRVELPLAPANFQPMPETK